jgi:hypothetical protein
MAPGPEDDVSQAEKRAVLRNDAAVRAHANSNGETGTYLSHTHIDDAGGRFAAVNAATIVGQTPAPKYPAASTPFQSDPVGVEPPLGFSVNDLEPSTNQLAPPVAVEEPGPASDGDAPSDLADELRAEDAGPLSYRGEPLHSGRSFQPVKFGNELATNVGKGGPGTGRTLYGQSGLQGQHGPVAGSPRPQGRGFDERS